MALGANVEQRRLGKDGRAMGARIGRHKQRGVHERTGRVALLHEVRLHLEGSYIIYNYYFNIPLNLLTGNMNLEN